MEPVRMLELKTCRCRYRATGNSTTEEVQTFKQLTISLFTLLSSQGDWESESQRVSICSAWAVLSKLSHSISNGVYAAGNIWRNATSANATEIWRHMILNSKTRFQLILPVDSHVTENLTGHRMHAAGTQICQINHWNNSFQNMYGMNRQQLTVWPGKLIFPAKRSIFAYSYHTYSESYFSSR